jgi:uncharacterized protein (DUF169 family)
LAANGAVFYTVPSDHYNCAIGSYTHNMPLPPNRAGELNETLDMMFRAGYIKPEEVPSIARLSRSPAAIVYAPLGETPVQPDAVLFVCRPATAMLLNEAAVRAGITSPLPPVGRPTCMALAVAFDKGMTVSLGCIGNRVYTDLQDDELYVVVPGSTLASVADAVEVITVANEELSRYALERRRALSPLSGVDSRDRPT